MFALSISFQYFAWALAASDEYVLFGLCVAAVNARRAACRSTRTSGWCTTIRAYTGGTRSCDRPASWRQPKVAAACGLYRVHRICRILYSVTKASHCCLLAPAEYILELIFAKLRKHVFMYTLGTVNAGSVT